MVTRAPPTRFKPNQAVYPGKHSTGTIWPLAQSPRPSPPNKKYTARELQKWLFAKALQSTGPTTPERWINPSDLTDTRINTQYYEDSKLARKFVFSQDMRTKDTSVVGKMYFFKYDPKWKHKLPIYDMAPLVFPIERYTDGFLGINFHYLNIWERMELLAKLKFTQNQQNMTYKTKLEISYGILKNMVRVKDLIAKHAGAENMSVRRYLFSHVRSKFIEVHPEEWDIAIQLPVADFVYNA
jgi:hypothetical protein